MNGDFSREHFARILGAEVMADIDRAATSAPPPSPQVVADLQRIFAPAVARLAKPSMVGDLIQAGAA